MTNLKWINRSFWSLVLLTALLFSFGSCDKETDYEKQAAIDRALIEQYVADNNLDGKFTLSGLYYLILEEGNGNYPNLYSVVKINYKGYLLDGYVFDEGYIAATRVNSLIPGMQEGLQYVDEGGKIKLIIPSGLAYGENESDDIPANSVLVFDVELLAFE